MTNLELRKELEKYPDDMPVMVDGYEGGVDYPIAVEKSPVQRKTWESGYEGDYDDTVEEDKNLNPNPIFETIIIRR